MVTRLQESTKHFALPGLCFNSAEAETLSRAFGGNMCFYFLDAQKWELAS
jgi:hypothetical protein